MYSFQALKMFFHTLFLLIQHMSPFYCYRKHIIIASRTASTLALVSSPVNKVQDTLILWNNVLLQKCRRLVEFYLDHTKSLS